MTKLLAGAFSAIPKRARVLRNGSVQFVDATNQPCWSDPEGRVLVSGTDRARLVLKAHGYEAGDMVVPSDGTEGVPYLPLRKVKKATDAKDDTGTA